MSRGSTPGPKSFAIYAGSRGRLRTDRIRVSTNLELLGNAVVQARIIVVGPADHDDGELVVAVHLIEDLPAHVLQGLIVQLQSRKALVDGRNRSRPR